MNQPPLPFKHLTVPPRHVQWLALANAGDYPDRKYTFYPFKTRFLRQHGITDGLDLQVITLKCYCGDGIFRGIDYDRPKAFWEPCHRCSGTGIYMVKNVVLLRWLLNGHLFHEPAKLILHTEHIEYRNKIEGLVKHEPVCPRAARRAMEKLLLRYEPRTFYNLWMRRWRDVRDGYVGRMRCRIYRIKRMLTLRGEEDVPF